MQIKPGRAGYYHAYLDGSAPVNLRTKDKAEAARLARESRLEDMERLARMNMLTAEAFQRLTAGRKMTCANAYERWTEWMTSLGRSSNTVYSYRMSVGPLIRSVGVSAPVNAISVTHIDGYVNSDEGASLSTRVGRLAAVRSFLKWCSANGYVTGNPADLVEVKKRDMSYEELEPKVRQPFTEPEIALLSAATEGFWRGVVLFGSEYGLRIGDVARLEWPAFSKSGKFIVHTAKSGKRLELPIVPVVRDFMLNEVAKVDPDYLWPERAEIALDVKRRGWLSGEFIRICRTLEIHGRSAHSLRHYFASKRAALGDTIDQIREKMAHSSAATTTGYIHAV